MALQDLSNLGQENTTPEQTIPAWSEIGFVSESPGSWWYRNFEDTSAYQTPLTNAVNGLGVFQTAIVYVGHLEPIVITIKGVVNKDVNAGDLKLMLAGAMATAGLTPSSQSQLNVLQTNVSPDGHYERGTTSDQSAGAVGQVTSDVINAVPDIAKQAVEPLAGGLAIAVLIGVGLYVWSRKK